MVYFEAQWKPATARLLLISTAFQLFISALFTLMEAFGESTITFKNLDEITEPPMKIENPLDIMKTDINFPIEEEKKEKKKRKKDKRKKKKGKKKRRKGKKKRRRSDDEGEEEEKDEEMQVPEPVEKEITIGNGDRLVFDSLTKSELVKKLEEDGKGKHKAHFFISWLIKSHILVTSIRIATPAHSFNGILFSYLHCILFILSLTLIWVESWKLVKMGIYLCSFLNAINLLDCIVQKSFQLDTLEWISDEMED